MASSSASASRARGRESPPPPRRCASFAARHSISFCVIGADRFGISSSFSFSTGFGISAFLRSPVAARPAVPPLARRAVQPFADAAGLHEARPPQHHLLHLLSLLAEVLHLGRPRRQRRVLPRSPTPAADRQHRRGLRPAWHRRVGRVGESGRTGPRCTQTRRRVLPAVWRAGRSSRGHGCRTGSWACCGSVAAAAATPAATGLELRRLDGKLDAIVPSWSSLAELRDETLRWRERLPEGATKGPRGVRVMCAIVLNMRRSPMVVVVLGGVGAGGVGTDADPLLPVPWAVQ